MSADGTPLQPSRRGNVFEEAARAQANAVGTVYDADAFTLGIVTNQSLKNRGGSTLFLNVPIAQRVLLRSDQTITIRLNATTNPAITVEGGVAYEIDWLQVSDIFVTTTAVSNPIKVEMI